MWKGEEHSGILGSSVIVWVESPPLSRSPNRRTPRTPTPRHNNARERKDGDSAYDYVPLEFYACACVCVLVSESERECVRVSGRVCSVMIEYVCACAWLCVHVSVWCVRGNVCVRESLCVDESSPARCVCTCVCELRLCVCLYVYVWCVNLRGVGVSRARVHACVYVCVCVCVCVCVSSTLHTTLGLWSGLTLAGIHSHSINSDLSSPLVPLSWSPSVVTSSVCVQVLDQLGVGVGTWSTCCWHAYVSLENMFKVMCDDDKLKCD